MPTAITSYVGAGLWRRRADTSCQIVGAPTASDLKSGSDRVQTSAEAPTVLRSSVVFFAIQASAAIKVRVKR